MTDNLGFVHRFLPSQDQDNETRCSFCTELVATRMIWSRSHRQSLPVRPSSVRAEMFSRTARHASSSGSLRACSIRRKCVHAPKSWRALSKQPLRGTPLIRSESLLSGTRNGANAASTVMFIRPGLIKGAILLRRMLVYEPEMSVDLSGSSVFISAGRMDSIVPTESVERLVELFQSARAKVTLKWRMVGHNLVPSEVSEAASWLALQRGTVSASL